MSHVAEVAGVSRQTVYNEFGSRKALVEAYVTREVENLVAEVESAVREHADDPSAALLADSLVRLAISHAIAPATGPETTSRDITRLVDPLIREILGR